MNTLGVTLTLAMLSTVSVSLTIPACEGKRDALHCYKSDGAVLDHRGLPSKDHALVELVSDVDKWTMSVRGTTVGNAAESASVEPQEKLRVTRRSTSDDLPLPPDSSTREARAESSFPTAEEMRLVLPEEEVQAYLEHWRAGKNYLSRLGQVQKGYVLTEEEQQQMEEDKRSYNQAWSIQRHVQGVLVQTGRARPKLVASYRNRYRVKHNRVVSARKRRDELAALIQEDKADFEELNEYAELVKMVQEVNKRAHKTRSKREAAERARMAELEGLMRDGRASDADRAEHAELVATFDRQRQRLNDLWEGRRTRLVELEAILAGPSATEADRAEYEELQGKFARKNEATREWRERTKAARQARLEELERQFDDEDEAVAAAARAEHAEIMAQIEAERAKRAEASRRSRAKRKAKAQAQASSTGQTTSGPQPGPDASDTDPSNPGPSSPNQFSLDPSAFLRSVRFSAPQLLQELKSVPSRLGQILRPTRRDKNAPHAASSPSDRDPPLLGPRRGGVLRAPRL